MCRLFYHTLGLYPSRNYFFSEYGIKLNFYNKIARIIYFKKVNRIKNCKFFNKRCDRLLAGNALGYIFMFDTNNGKCLRKITEAHPYGNSILHVKFTDDPTVACFSDSGGSVFMLEFKRTMGMRSADSTCIFSGSRGEVFLNS